MSAEATGWVFRESPYSGAYFAVHLAIADTVNDTYGNEFWASCAHLAVKARVSERMVRRALHQMTQDEVLVIVSAKPGTTKRFKFAMHQNPGQGVTPDKVSPRTPEAKTPDKVSATPELVTKTPDKVSPNPKRTQEIPKGSQSKVVAVPDLFDEFWTAYPKKVDKPMARKAWLNAIKTAEPSEIIAGAIAYANDLNRDPEFTKNPQGWLNGTRWTYRPEIRPKIDKHFASAQAWAERKRAQQ